MPNTTKLYFKPTIAAIYDVLQMENCSVSGIKGIPATNRITFSPGRIDLLFEANCREISPSVILENLPALTLETEKATYEVPRYHAYFDGQIRMDAVKPQQFDLRLNQLTQATIDRENRHYWRFLFPVENNEWFLKIQALNYKDDFGSTHFRNMIVAELGGHKLNVFSSKVDGINWMVIDSVEPVTYAEMDHCVLSLTIALGLVLGKRYGDYCFHVQSDLVSFARVDGVEAIALQETKRCSFQILNSDVRIVEKWLQQYECQQYALDDLRRQKEGNVTWFYNDESTVTSNAFNKLAQLCYGSNDLMLAASMLIDGSMLNIEYQKPFFLVALETITSSLMKNEDLALPPTMPKDRFENDVVPVLVDALNGIPGLPEDARRVFSQRITHNLNTAPNANKLEACFPKFGYNLTDADRSAIKNRNKTFHGTLSNEERSLGAQQNEMLSINLRLHKLCSILLLKAAGFSGQVLNNEVLFGIKDACERKEPVFIEI